MKPTDIQITGYHCGDCPYLIPYKHPFYTLNAWCSYLLKELDWYDYWICECETETPDEALLKCIRTKE